MRVLTVIPARGGSKAIPRKNLVDLAGRPLIAWTIEAATRAGLERVVVSTDSPEIADVARRLGADAPFLRPAELATDEASAISVARHAMEVVSGDWDAVLYLQPTSPFRAAEDVHRALDLLAIGGTDSVISVVDVGGTHPARMKFLEDGVLIDPPFGEDQENQPRQRLRPMVIRNGAIYLTRAATLRQGSFKGRVSRGLLMPAVRSVNIDDVDDLEYARWIANRKP